MHVRECKISTYRVFRGILAVVLVFSMVFGIMPPIKVSAANATISNLGVNPDTIGIGESVSLSGTVKTTSGYYLRAIQIQVRRYGDDRHGYLNDKKTFEFSEKRTNFNLSVLKKVVAKDYLCTGDNSTETLDVGTHTIKIHVGLYDKNGNSAEGISKSVTFTVEKNTGPERTLDTPDLLYPPITGEYDNAGYFWGEYSDLLDTREDHKIRWENVDADYYAVNIVILSGEPNPAEPSEKSVSKIVSGYRTSKTYYTISSDELTGYAGKWVKVSIQPMMNNEDYGLRGLYYFKLETKEPSCTLDTPALEEPPITRIYNKNGYYYGKYDGTIDCTSKVPLYWEDVGADYYALNIIVLRGEPDPDNTSEDRVAEIKTNYEISRLYYTIPVSKIKGYAGKWVKVSIQPMMNSGDYGYRGLYYFKLADPSVEAPLPIISSDTVSTTVTMGEAITCKAEIDGNGGTLSTVTVGITSPTNSDGSYDTIYLRQTNIGKSSYTLNRSIQTGKTITGSDESGKTKEMSMAQQGTYKIKLYAINEGGTSPVTKEHSVTVTAPEEMQIHSITPSADTISTREPVDFSIMTSSSVKYGVALYAESYFLGETTVSSKVGSALQYVYEGQKFTQSGTRTIYAYPILADGTYDTSVYACCTVSVKADSGVIGNPTFTVDDGQTISLGSVFSVSWKAPATPSSGIVYNVYMFKSGSTENVLVADEISTRSCTISAAQFDSAGTYIITVYAVAPGYRVNPTGAVLTVHVKDPNALCVKSVTPSVIETPTMTAVDFTITTSKSAKYGVAVYAGRYHLATITEYATKADGLLYTYNGHFFTSGGIKNIYAYPLGVNGEILQETEASASCTIEVTTSGVCAVPKNLQFSSETVKPGENVTLSWQAPSVPSTGCVFNVYMARTENANGEPIAENAVCIGERLSTTKITCSLPEEGTYLFTVYATAAGYSQSKGASASVYAASGSRLTVDVQELKAYEYGGTGRNVTVSGNVNWVVSSDVSWITFTTQSGSGTGSFAPVIAANTETTERTGHILVTGGGITRTITVIQGGIVIVAEAQEDTVYNKETNQIRVQVYTEKTAGSGDWRLTSGATVMYAVYTRTTDANGIATLPYVRRGNYGLTVTLPGYSTQRIDANKIKADGNAIDVQMYAAPAGANPEPVINAVWLGYENILKEEYTVSLVNSKKVDITAQVDWGSGTAGSICLWQNGQKAVFNGDKLSVVLSDHFDVSKSIFIVATNANGKETKEKLKFVVGGAYPDWVNGASIEFGNSLAFTLPDPASNVKLSFSFADDLVSPPVKIAVDGNKVYIAMGPHMGASSSGKTIEEVKKIKNIYTNVKALGSKPFSISQLQKTLSLDPVSTKFGIKARATLVGYAEGYVPAGGGLVILDGGIIVTAEGKGSCTIPFAAGPVPMVLEGELSTKTTLTGSFTTGEAKKFTPNIKNEGEIAIKGGVGVGVTLASVTGGVIGKIKTYMQMPSFYFRADASLSLYIKSKLAIWEAEKKFDDVLKGTVFEYPAASTKTYVESMNADIWDTVLDTSAYTLQSREYLQHPSGFRMTADPLVQNDVFADVPMSLEITERKGTGIEPVDVVTPFFQNVYPQAEPEIAQFDDGTMIAVFIGDEAGRSSANRTCLYYTYFNGLTWSDPKPVDLLDDGTADFSPSVVVANGIAYIAWQNASRVFADTETLEDVAPYFDISLAEYDPKVGGIVSTTTWSCGGTTWLDEGLNMMPQLCVSGANVHLVWIRNTAYDWYGLSGKNLIIWYALQEDGWSEERLCGGTSNAIRSLFVYPGNSGGMNAVYLADTDGDLTTNEDVELVRVFGVASFPSVSVGAMSSAQVYDHTLYGIVDGTIVSVPLSEREPSEYISIWSDDKAYGITDFTLVEGNGEKYILVNVGEGLTSRLGVIVYDQSSDTWSDIVFVTDGTTHIDHYDAIFTEDGQTNGILRVLVAETEVIGEIGDVEPYGQSNIMLYDLRCVGDLMVNEVFFNETHTVADTTAEFYADVENSGRKTIHGFLLYLFDENGTLLSRSVDDTVLLPGETATLCGCMNITEKMIGQNVRVEVWPCGVNDWYPTNNIGTLTLDYTDLAVEAITWSENEAGQTVISANIVNRGYTAESGIQVLLKKTTESSTEGEVSTQAIRPTDDMYVASDTVTGTLTSFDTETVHFTVDYEEGALYSIEILTPDNDMHIANNSDYVVLYGGSIKSETGVAVSGTVTSSDSNTASEEDDTITILLANDEHTYTTTITSFGINNTVDYRIENVSAGTYTMTVSKANHVTREYEIVVSGSDVMQDVKIYLLGDVNMDGFVKSNDMIMVRQYLLTNLTLDTYQQKLADTNGNGEIQSNDLIRLRQHLLGNLNLHN